VNTNEIPQDGPSDWQPITNKRTLALLGKLGEEASELSSAAFRCIIQGVDEVLAMLAIIQHDMGLNQGAIMRRQMRKMNYKQPWFDALKDQGEVP